MTSSRSNEKMALPRLYFTKRLRKNTYINAVNLLLAAFSTYLSDAQGQIMVFFIMVVAAAEAAVGLGILVMIYRNTKSTDISLLDKLRN